MKCEDMLMTSDLFSNDLLFKEFSNDPLNSPNENPFDFISSPDPLSSFPSPVDVENPQSLYYPPHQSSVDVSEQKELSKTTAFENTPSIAKDSVPNSSPSVLVAKVTVCNKEVAAPQQIRNIQPKPDTSSYRIVPVKSISNVSNSQPQTIKICNASSISPVDSVSPSSKETNAKKVVSVADIGLLNNTNAEKQVMYLT